MTIEELRKTKAEIECDICNKLVEFEHKTGLEIASVSYEKDVRRERRHYNFTISFEI